MTRLHDVLDDIASDLTPTDLTAGVKTRARRIRLVRRARLAGTALGVAGAISVGSLVLPNLDDSPSDREVATVPTQEPSPEDLVLDLDAATTGGLQAADLLFVVAAPDGSAQPVVADAEGLSARLDLAVPEQLERAELSTDGTRALLLGATEVVVADVTTGEDLLRLPREEQEWFAMRPDGQTLVALAQTAPGVPGDSRATWGVDEIDVVTGDRTPTAYSFQRATVDPLIWAGPDGHFYIRFFGAVFDNRTFRVDLETGETLYSEPYESLGYLDLRWSADGSAILAEMPSSIRVLDPTDEIGTLRSTITADGELAGFHGDDQVLFWRPLSTGIELITTDEDGGVVGTSTTVRLTGTVTMVASIG